MIISRAFIQVIFFLLTITLDCAVADMNEMDMSMDGSMNLASGNMLSYLHFTKGDVVWFQGWVPTSDGAMAGACIGLFLLGLFDRWLSAFRSMMERQWRKQLQIEARKSQISSPGTPFLMRTLVPLQYDLPRGVVQAAQSALEFAFMLVAMTYQVAFIFSMIIGLGVGETLFGRYNVYAHIS